MRQPRDVGEMLATLSAQNPGEDPLCWPMKASLLLTLKLGCPSESPRFKSRVRTEKIQAVNLYINCSNEFFLLSHFILLFYQIIV